MYRKLMEKLGFYDNGEEGYLQLDIERKGIALVACMNLEHATMYVNGEEYGDIQGVENVLGAINNALI